MQIYISQPPPSPQKKHKTKKKQNKKKTSKRKNKTKHNKTETYLEFHYYPNDTERISAWPRSGDPFILNDVIFM